MRLRQRPSPCFITKLLELGGGRPNKGDASGVASRSEIMAFTEEPVTWVNGIGVGCNRCGNDGVDIQISGGARAGQAVMIVC